MKKKFFIIGAILLAVFGAYLMGKRGKYSEPLSLITPQFKSPTNTTQSLMKEEILPAPGTADVSRIEEETEAGSISDRLIIKRGSFSLLVKETLKAVEEAEKIAESLSGFVLSSHTWYSDEKQERMKGEVTIKVPVDKFSEAISQLKGLAIKTVSEQITGKDVTEEYTDLESRLRNLEATEEQLLEIMKRAGKITEILEVQRELTRVRGQIETTEGRMKYLKESAVMSTLSVYIATEEEELPIVEEKWRPMRVIKASLRTLIGFWQKIANTLIWIGVFFSPFIVLVILIWLVGKIRR